MRVALATPLHEAEVEGLLHTKTGKPGKDGGARSRGRAIHRAEADAGLAVPVGRPYRRIFDLAASAAIAPSPHAREYTFNLEKERYKWRPPRCRRETDRHSATDFSVSLEFASGWRR
jgi:hypothetical protein